MNKKKSSSIVTVVVLVVYCVTFFTSNVYSAERSFNKDYWTVDSLVEETKKIPSIVYERYPDIGEIINKSMKYCEKEKDFEKVDKYVKSLDKYKELSIRYGQNDVLDLEQSKQEKIIEMMKTDEYKEQEKRINSLAKKYYDFYKKNGCFPEDGSEEANALENGLELMYAPTYAEGVAIMAEAGYVMSEVQLARACAAAGSAALIDGPLPVGDIIALVACVAILGTYVATHLAANQTAVCNQIAYYFSSSASQCAAQAIASSTVYQNNKNTYKYFFAKLNWSTPGGGIRIMYPINYTTAVNTLQYNSSSDNVFTTYSTDANNVANSASYPGGAYNDPAHTTYNGNPKPNNLPHYHPAVWWLKQSGHSFYIY